MKSQIMKFIVVLAVIIVFAYPISAQQSGEHDFNFEYAAKIICGTIKKSDNARLARGTYATTINIHNPNDTSVVFLKKLALTFPPEEQRPGRIDTIGIDNLKPDQALKVDCMDIRRLLPNEFPLFGYIEGFVIIKSTKSLDVTGVYTSAKLGSFLSPQNVTSIDVEQIRERKTKGPLPELPEELDHFKVYKVDPGVGPLDREVFLKGQFETDNQAKQVKLGAINYFANPTSKVHSEFRTAIKDSNRHFNWYALNQVTEPQRTVWFHNQFVKDKKDSVEIKNPKFLLVPTRKRSHPGSVFPDSLDHYLCYEVMNPEPVPDQPIVTLGDQFVPEETVQVIMPKFFCVPVSKYLPGESQEEDRRRNCDDHLVIYEITSEQRPIPPIEVEDQFEPNPKKLTVIQSVMLAVPTEKLKVETQSN